MDEKEIRQLIEEGRAHLRTGYSENSYPDYQTDQQLKRPQPPLAKAPMRQEAIDLPMDFEGIEIETDFLTIVNRRSSHRVYTEEEISLKQLSYLLWCMQGVKEIRGRAYATLRTVPCGGARHPFETYMALRKVEGLQDGLYHYLPMGHKIEFLGPLEDLKGFMGASLMGQVWAAKANIIFYFSIVFYRSEWRYGIHAHRGLMTDAGHITENLYLACTALGIGGCAIGAVDGKLCDEVFGLDGEEESIVYAQPVGTVCDQDKDKEQDFYAFVKEQDL